VKNQLTEIRRSPRFALPLLALLWLATMSMSAGAVEVAPGYLWYEEAESITFSGPDDIALDADQNAYVTGNVQLSTLFGGIDLVENLTNYTTYPRHFLTKLNPQGTPLWVHDVNTDIADCPLAVAATTDGVYVGGLFRNLVNFGDVSQLSRTWSAYGSRVFLAKYDGNGNLTWVREVGQLGASSSKVKLALDSSGNVYLAGCYDNFANFGQTQFTNVSNSGIFILKLDGAGNVIRGSDIQFDPGMNYVCNLALDSVGNLVVAGAFTSWVTVENQNGPAIEYINDDWLRGAAMFLASYDSTGALKWVRPDGLGGACLPSGLCVDAAGNIMVGGSFQASATFGGVPLTNSLHQDVRDLFLVKYKADGNPMWARQVVGNGNKELGGLAVDPVGDVYAVGNGTGSHLFGETAFLASTYDERFVAKYHNDGKLAWLRHGNGEFGKSTGVATTASGNAVVIGMALRKYFTYWELFVEKLASSAAVSPPDILVQPASNQVVHQGDNATFSVVTGGAKPQRFQWQFNGHNLAGATGSTLVVPTVGPANVGRYQVVVSNAYGSVTSSNATIVVAPKTVIPNFEWARSGGGLNYDVGTSVAADTQGNVYVGGLFTTVAMIGTNLLVGGDSYQASGFLAKYGRNGEVLWAKALGGTNLNMVDGIAVDRNGAVFVTGVLNGETTFENGTTIRGNYFTAKFTTQGRLLWVIPTGGQSIAVDLSGNVYVVGSGQPYGADWFYPPAYVAKYDTNGRQIWRRAPGDRIGFGLGHSLAVDFLGNVYVAGINTWNPTVPANSPFGPVLVKLNALGTVQWTRETRYIGNVPNNPSVAVDNLGNVFMGGTFENSLNLGNITLSPAGYASMFIAKYDSLGRLSWAHAVGSEKVVQAWSVCADSRGVAYVAGGFSGTVRFGDKTFTKIPSNYELAEDAFIAAYGPEGGLRGVRQIGFPDGGWPICLTVDNLGQLYMTGAISGPGDGTESSAAFGSSTIATTLNGGGDFFVGKTKVPLVPIR
jgi:Immunoglobulin domain